MCSCGLGNKCDFVQQHCRVVPSFAATRYDILTARSTQWLNDGVINGFIRLLNIRQRRLEADGFSVPNVLYMDCFFHTNLTDDAGSQPGIVYASVKKRGTASQLLRNAGCSRCILQQDLLVIPVHVGGNHWICILLDFRSCEIFCFDALGVSIAWMPWACHARLISWEHVCASLTYYCD